MCAHDALFIGILIILLYNLLICMHMHIRYVRISLRLQFLFMVRSETFYFYRSPPLATANIVIDNVEIFVDPQFPSYTIHFPGWRHYPVAPSPPHTVVKSVVDFRYENRTVRVVGIAGVRPHLTFSIGDHYNVSFFSY